MKDAVTKGRTSWSSSLHYHDAFIGWIKILPREIVKSQSLENLTLNSESASKIMPACEVWVLECICKCLFFQKTFSFVLMGKLPQKWTNLKNFCMLPILMSWRDHAFLSFCLSLRILVFSPCWNSALFKMRNHKDKNDSKYKLENQYIYKKVLK